ncbi:MAG: RNA polymerase sigma factor [Deltaproteobacteria bacterium]|nr:RNA polymerase sigma factor [Kofleriaceae bacterium]
MSTRAATQFVPELLAHRAELLAYLRRLGCAAVAEDLFQSSLLRLLERDLTPREPARALGWFQRILHNAAMDHLRASTRHAALRDSIRPGGDASDAPVTAEAAATLLGRLAPRHRDALRTVFLDGGSLGELAAREGITRNAAAVRVHRARRALEAALAA